MTRFLYFCVSSKPTHLSSLLRPPPSIYLYSRKLKISLSWPNPIFVWNSRFKNNLSVTRDEKYWLPTDYVFIYFCCQNGWLDSFRQRQASHDRKDNSACSVIPKPEVQCSTPCNENMTAGTMRVGDNSF